MTDFTPYAPQKVFLLQGDERVFETILHELVSKNPLTQALSVPRFTIDHARNVAEFAREGTGEIRTFVVYFSSFSPEAAQVLLKSLEEPSPHTYVVFVTRYPYLMPQTIRSRMMLVRASGVSEIEQKKKILDAIKKEAGEKEDDPATRRARALDLLDRLERSLEKQCTHAAALYEAKRLLFFGNLPTKYVLDYVVTAIA